MLLRNARVATLDPPRVEAVDLRLEQGAISARGPALAAGSGEETLDLDGAFVLPGLVNAHTHLYSALARGMPGPAAPPRSFVEILERVWWRLDRALDEETVHLSGLVGAIEAVRSGTTTLVDHHASPAFIRGSLGVLRRATEAVGVRAVFCYETTDRNGLSGRDEGVEENRAFAAAVADAPLTRALVGAHASFTLSDESLDRLAALVAETGRGLHVHVAEDRADVEDCRRRTGKGLAARFRRHGLLVPGSVFAHGVHLDPDEIEEVEGAGVSLVHNPRSNMNNAVGLAPVHLMTRAALGTDGMDEDILAEARAALLALRRAGRDDAFTVPLRLLAGGHRLASALFARPLGTLAPGAAADLVVLDYRPPTPIDGSNLAGHLLFGIDRSHVRSVLVAGRWALRDRRVTGVDETAVFAGAEAAARGLWKRMASLA